jgi:hypothetical protein
VDSRRRSVTDETKRVYSERDVTSLEALNVLIVAKTLLTLCKIE